MRIEERVKDEADIAMSEIIIDQKFVTEEDLPHLEYAKAALQREQSDSNFLGSE